jgi:hypothetical protein
MPPGTTTKASEDHEVVQPGEERPVLEGLLDERIDVLLERQVDADAQRPFPHAGARRPLVGRLHQSRPAAGDDVAPHLGKRGGGALDLVVHERSGLGARGAEDGDAVALAARTAGVG